MKNPFKKPSLVKEGPQATLQSIQQEFNQCMFELGDLYYRKHMIRQELSRIEDNINSHQQKADNMGKEASKLRQKIQAEVKTKVEEGDKDEQGA